MNPARFPVVLLDCKETLLYDSLLELEHGVEPIDVAGDGYGGWDSDSFPITLSSVSDELKQGWLRVSRSSGTPEPHKAAEAITAFAAEYGCPVRPLTGEPPVAYLARVEKWMDENPPPKRSLWHLLWGRRPSA